MRHALCLWVVLVGCGAADRPLADRAGDDRAPAHDRTNGDDRPAARAPGACPARFGDRSPTCDDGDVPLGCAYPEGSCSCQTGTWCGGAAPPPMPLLWTCSSPPVPCPRDGEPCTGAGHCTTDPCGFHGVSCVNGVWTSFMSPLPP